MDVQTGMGPTAYVMIAAALAAAAYPMWHVTRMIRARRAGTRTPELVFLAALTLFVIAGIIPASLANVGWILVPLLVLLLSALYASVFSALAKSEGRASIPRLLTFVVPLAAMAAGSAAESIVQASQAQRVTTETLITGWGFWSVFVLTVAPPLVSVAMIGLVHSRSSPKA